jgi:hypothetical protein
VIFALVGDFLGIGFVIFALVGDFLGMSCRIFALVEDFLGIFSKKHPTATDLQKSEPRKVPNYDRFAKN